MHTRLIFTLRSWLHQGCGRSEAGANQSCWLYLILDIREVWDGEEGTVGHSAAADTDGARVGCFSSAFLLSVLSLLFALHTEHLQQVSFLQQTASWKGEFEPAEGQSLTVGKVVCVLCSGSCPLGTGRALKRWSYPLYLHCWKLQFAIR